MYFVTIEHRGDFNNSNNNLDGWIYGCDICQEVCPWNNKFAETTELENFQPRSEIINYNNNDWNDLSHEEYNAIFKKSSVKRTKYKGLKRNININKVE